MIYILCSLVFLLPTLAGIGALVEKIAGKLTTGFASKLVLGICSVAILWTILAFFIPLNIYVELLTLAIGLGAFFFFKIYEDFAAFFLRNFFVFTVLSLVIVFAGAYYPFVLDHFGYYVPTVKWLSEIGLVKGISNLDLLLGQMSVWHIFQAGFSNFSDPFLRMNVVVLVILLIYILEKRSWVHLIFLPVLFLFSQSPSPDLPVIVLSLIVLTEVLQRNKNVSLLFFVSMVVFSMKPTMIWLPLLVFFYGLLIKKVPLKFLLGGLVVFAVFLVKNIYTFGFPVFPVQFVDLGVAWKPNENLLQSSAQIAIEKTFDMQFSFQEIQKFSTGDYILQWLTLNGIKGKIHVLFIASLLGFIIYAFRRKSKIVWIIAFSILVKSILVLLFSAQYRFFIDVFFVIFFVFFCAITPRKVSLISFAVLSALIIGFLSFPDLIKRQMPSFKLSHYMMGFNRDQFMEPSDFGLNSYQTHSIGNLDFNLVNGYPFSFDTPIPAISPGFVEDYIKAGIFPQKMGSDVKDGFIWRKTSPEEQKKLKEIMEDFYQAMP